MFAPAHPIFEFSARLVDLLSLHFPFVALSFERTK